MEQVGTGKVHDSYGLTSFEVKYKAIVLKPFKNEVMDAVVESVNKMGFFANVGPLQVFVSNHVIFVLLDIFYNFCVAHSE